MGNSGSFVTGVRTAGGAVLTLVLGGSLLFLAIPASGARGAPATDAARCAALSDLKLSGAVVTAARLVSQGALTGRSTAAPADMCRAEVLVTTSPVSDLKVEVWLPLAEAWNGKLLGTGNGGAGGQIQFGALADGLVRGYATINTDYGTRAPMAPDAFRALLGKPETQLDLTQRGTHLMTVVGKKLAAAYYQRPPAHTLFLGCSAGGGEGMAESQRYPEDYDGIAAGDPPVDIILEGLLQGKTYADSRRDPASVIGREKLPAIAREVLRECDALDGLKDGLIADPRRCRFDPAVMQCAGPETADCLTPRQVAALREIYDGLRGPNGELLYAGFSPGAEATPGALARIAGLNAGSLINPATPGPLVWALGPAWTADNWLDFDFKTQLLPTADRGAALESSSLDLRAFAKRGGKIIFFSGWHDALQNPAQLIGYFERMESLSGGPAPTARFARLFLFPGMEHCRGGVGPNDFLQFGAARHPPGLGDPRRDVVAALDEWVTHGRAPQALIATKYEQDDPDRRPLRSLPACAYPSDARWTGKGSVLEAANYVCVAPQD